MYGVTGLLNNPKGTSLTNKFNDSFVWLI
jgi:hypothetical protein